MGVTFLSAVEVGGYVSVFKSIVVLLVMLVWFRLLTWVDRDTVASYLPRKAINSGLLAGVVIALAVFFLLPLGFLISFPILILFMAIEAGIYLALRHRKVGLADLQVQFNAYIKSLKAKTKKTVELPNTVILLGKSGPLAPPGTEDPDRPAYDAMQTALTEPLLKGAEQIDVTPAAEGVVVKYFVDGFGYKGATLERDTGAGAISMMKLAAGLNIEDRRKPQRGMVKATIEGKKVELRVDTAGSTAGEYMRITSDPKKRHDFALDKLGFTASQLEVMKGMIKDKTGLVIVNTPKGQGLSSLMYAIIRAHDAFLEHIHTIERAPEVDLEGITQNKLAANATAADEQSQTSWVISQEPDVIMLPRIESTQTARDLIAFAKEKRVYVGLAATSTFEAVNAWRKLVGDDRTAASSLRLVINGRVLRKLCMACKVGYAPDPATLRKLNLDPAKVKELFQARTEPLRDPKGNPVLCEFCQELHFKGRTGVFELFVLDDEARQVIAGGMQSGPLRAVFRKTKGRYLQEEALALVEVGETSVQEVLRVLKVGDSSPEAAAAAPAKAGAPVSPAGAKGSAAAKQQPAKPSTK